MSAAHTIEHPARKEMSQRITSFGPDIFLTFPTLTVAADKLWHDWERVHTGQTPTGDQVHVFLRANTWCAFNAKQHRWAIDWNRKDHIARWYAFVSLFSTDQILFADTLVDLVEGAADSADDDACSGWASAASALLEVDHPEQEAALALAALGGLGGVHAMEVRRAETMARLRSAVAASIREP